MSIMTTLYNLLSSIFGLRLFYNIVQRTNKITQLVNIHSETMALFTVLSSKSS